MSTPLDSGIGETIEIRYESFRQLLQETLNERCKKNPAYSLRSFAQSLGVNHAILSLLLRNKRKMTERHVLTIGGKLGLQSEDLSYYIEQLKLQEPIIKESKSSEIKSLSADHYELFLSWTHDAILELMRTRDFRSDVSWISNRLGVTTDEVQSSLDRLIRLNLVRKNENGELEDLTGDTTSIPYGETTTAVQRLHQKALLEISSKKIDSVPLDHRSHTSITIAIPLKKVNTAKQMIREFRKRLVRALQDTRQKNEEVYQVQISFFPLTNLNQGEKAP